MDVVKRFEDGMHWMVEAGIRVSIEGEDRDGIPPVLRIRTWVPGAGPRYPSNRTSWCPEMNRMPQRVLVDRHAERVWGDVWGWWVRDRPAWQRVVSLAIARSGRVSLQPPPPWVEDYRRFLPPDGTMGRRDGQGRGE